MREFKFRVWHPDEYRIYYFSNFEEIVDWQHGDGYRVENDESCQVTYMQSTGLHDKNGKEIYEGDIVTDDFLNLSKEDEKFLVAKENNYIFLKLIKYGNVLNNIVDPMTFSFHARQGNIEILGNIYENTELLEVENE